MHLIIGIINRSSIPANEVRKAMVAINIQLKRDFGQIWRIAAKMKTLDKNADPMKSCDAVIYLHDKPPEEDEGFMGYHDTVKEYGFPFGYAFTEVSKEMGEAWTVTFSHEVLEMVLNQQVNMYARGPHPSSKERIVDYWLEACDAVQDTTYFIEGVEVSNFVLPSYFTPYAEKTKHNDFLRTPGLKSFGMLPGGYVGFTDPRTGEDETVFADEKSKFRYDKKAKMGAVRRSSRALPFTRNGVLP